MVVMMPREKWTDERLDDLNKKVDKGFEEMKAEFKDVRREMNEGFARVDGEFKDVRREMNERFDKVDASLQGLYRVLAGGAFVIIAALIGLNAF
jgi:ribosome recycling factor